MIVNRFEEFAWLIKFGKAFRNKGNEEESCGIKLKRIKINETEGM